MNHSTSPEQDSEWLQTLQGKRLGPYCSFNPVNPVQIWQWCSALGDNNPLFNDPNYRQTTEFERAVAPPAMMQMWTMRDINDNYAPGSTDEPPYQVFDALQQRGLGGNVAVSYDIEFHRYLQEGDRAQHFTTIVSISDLKKTALGEGYFVTEQVEYLDQDDALFARALITYFQYRPASDEAATDTALKSESRNVVNRQSVAADTWQSSFKDISFDSLQLDESLPELCIPITHRLIVGGAIATQDFVDVHHNVNAAKKAAMPDIFMNILTTSGLSARYLSDWAGPGSRLKKLAFKLLAPNHPGDTMCMQGKVVALESTVAGNSVSVEFAGKNTRAYHVLGSAELKLAK